MASPQLVAAADRTSSEADIRALALAKVKAGNAYTAALYANRNEKTDDELVDLELAQVAALKNFQTACSAFDKAV